MQRHEKEKVVVALVITDLEVGGAERALVDLATRLDRQRFDPAVYCLKPRPLSQEGSCAPLLEAAGIPVHFLGFHRHRHLAFALLRLKRLLARQKPDLVQTFLFHANLLGRIAARWAGVARVVSGIRVAERGRAWHLWADRLTDRLVDRHVCVSEAVARFSRERARLPAAKLVVIANGIDVSRYPASRAADTQQMGIPRGRQLVTYVGRLDRQKGVEWLIEGAAEWLKQLPDCDLLLVGKGPARPALEARCRQRGLCDRVRFAGWRSDVPEILAASRLLVLPSAWEGMPNVVLQAMASRLPVLASDVEGVRELLGPLSEPQTAPYGNTEVFSARLVRLMTDPALAAQLGEHNRLRVEAEFPLGRMVRGYERLWESLAGHGSAG